MDGADMKRRSFLKFLAATPAAAVTLPVALPAATSTLKYVGSTWGRLSSAGAKHVQYGLGFTISGNMPKALWPGVKDFFDKHYDQEIVFKDLYKD